MSGLAERAGITKDIEREHRRKLAAMCRMCGMQDMIGLFGHISLRIPGTDLVLMTPGAGADKTTVRADELYVFDVNGTVLYRPGGDFPLPFPAEWRIHTQIHRDRADAMVVAHLHAPDSTLLGIINRDIVPVYNQAFELGERVPTWDDPGLVLDDEAAAELSVALGAAPACQMRGHGSVVVGRTPELAFMNCFAVEQNARYQIAAEPFGGAVPFTAEKIARAKRQRNDLVVAGSIWEYFERKAVIAGGPL